MRPSPPAGTLTLFGPEDQATVEVEAHGARYWVGESIAHQLTLSSAVLQVYVKWEGPSVVPPAHRAIELAGSTQASLKKGDEHTSLDSGQIELSVSSERVDERERVVVAGRVVGKVGSNRYEAEFEVVPTLTCIAAWNPDADTGVAVPEGGTPPSGTPDPDWSSPFCQQARRELGLP